MMSTTHIPQPPEPNLRQKLVAFFIAPSPQITDIGAYRQAQVLAGLSLALSLSILLGILATPVEMQTTTALWVQIILVILFSLAYIASRTPYFMIGSWAIAIALTLAPFVLIISGASNDAQASLLSFIPMAFIIGTFLLSPWGFAGLAIVASIGAFALPAIASVDIAANEATNVGGILITLGGLFIIAGSVQRSIERSRLTELQIANAELQELQNSLEARVQERTSELVQSQQATQLIATDLENASRIARMANYEFIFADQIAVFNNQFFELLGTTAAAEGGHRLPISRAVERFFHPEDRSRLLEDLRLVGTIDRDLEYRLLHSNGDIRHFAFRFALETEHSNTPPHVKGVLQDITERKQAEEALRQTEDIYRRAIASADAVAYSRRYGDEAFTFMGEKIFQMTGYNAEEITPAIFDTLLEETIVHSVPAAHEEAVQQARAGQVQNWKADYRLRTRDGRFRWVSDNSIELIGADGKSTGSVGIMLDITERKENEVALAHQARELEIVTELATAIATISDPSAMLQTVVDLTQTNFDLYHAHIYLLNEIGDRLELTVGAGDIGRKMTAQKHAIPLNRAQSLVARAARSQQAVAVNNVTQNPNFLPNPLLPNTLAELAVPIIVGEAVLGVLDVQADEIDYFTDEEIRIQTILAAQIGVALQNARATEQTAHTLAELDALTRRLTREGWQTYLADTERIRFSLAEDGVIQTDEIGISSAVADKTIIQPVSIQGERIGQIITADVDSDEEELQDILTAVSQSLSAHLENLRLSEQTERALAETQARTEELALINRIVTAVSASFDIQESIQKIVDALVENTSADQARIALKNPEGTYLSILAESFNPELSSSALGLTIPIAGNTLTEHVLETRQSYIVDDPQHDPILASIHHLMAEQGVEQLMVIPMIVGNEVMGTLGMDLLTKSRRFSEDDLRLAETLVFQVATAIQNARLFEQVQARARQEQILREVTARVYAAPDAESVLKTAAQEVSRVLGTEAMVYLNDTEHAPHQNGH